MKSSHWQKVPLGNVCDVIAGGTPSRKNSKYFGGNIPWVKISDMLQGLITSTDETITEAGLENSAARIIPSGTVLISIFATVGRTAILGIDAATNQAIVGVIPKSAVKLNTKFLRYCLDNSILELTKEARGVAQVNINSKILKSLKIPLPPLPEQERIVRLLDEAEGVRQLRAQAKARMEQFVPALFQEMFGDYEEVTTLGNLVEEFRYGTSNKSNPNGYPTLRIPNVIGQKVDLDDLKYVPVSDDEFKRVQLNDGDILFVRSNGNPDNIGRSAVFESHIISEAGYEPEKFIHASYLIRARLKKEMVNPHYLQMYLSTNNGRKEVKKRARTSAGQYNINTENLSTIPVLLPPLALQHKFAGRVSEARQVQSAQGRSAEKIEALYQSMLALSFTEGLSRAFAGEL